MEITIFIALFFFIIFLTIIYYILINTKIYCEFNEIRKFSNTLPGPSFWELLENSKNENDLLDWFKKLKERYGRIFCIWMGKVLVVFVTDPEDAKEVLSNNKLLHKSENYRYLQPWLGKGLLTNGGESWHRRRKMLTPAFHFKILESFKQPMEFNCDILISRLHEKAKKNEEFDIYPYITLFTLDVICETAMGIKRNAQLQSETEYVQAIQEICKIIHKQHFTLWQRIPFLFNISKPGKAMQRTLKILHGETYRVINLRKKLLEHDYDEIIKLKENDDFTETKRRLAFLDMLLIAQKEGQPLTDQDIREEVDTFMFEGHDTTSSTLSFAIYLLATNSDVQQKAYEEAVEFEGKENESMKYLEATIKEVLRLYPAVPFFGRCTTEDTFIRNIKIPKGVAISASSYLVHRNEKEFPEPEKFLPDRHLDTEVDRHPFAFIAFSAGTRNCIGQKFAMLELKSTLSRLLRNFELLPAENFIPTPVPELVLKSSKGIKLRLKPRCK